MKKLNKFVAALFWVVGMVALCAKSEPFYGGLFFLPFALGPQILTHVGILYARSRGAQITLFIALVVYFSWFSFIFVEIFYLNPDPQGPVALLFVGVYSTPVMLVLWVISALFEHRLKKAQAPGNV
ncbi:MAG: hypothetical protein DRP71_08920 [Verrucomicrobia bacterium]|nr:MAG: hypothetical protein DRP71_08920 [Verrucomicrobiota bacterium]